MPLAGGSRKYGPTSACNEILRKTMISERSKLQVSAGLAKGTWERHTAAKNAFNLFEKFDSKRHDWPLSVESISNFIAWGFDHKNLKATTVKSYVNSLKTIHELKNLSSTNFNSKIVKIQLKGIENLEIYKTEVKATRKVMTLPLLKLIGHKIANSSWNTDSKQVCWTACCIAFFGCFRIGEIFAKTEYGYCPEDTLLWSDVKVINSDHILIHIKNPKSRAKEGEFVDIFPFKGHGTCPVKSLLKLKEMKKGAPQNSPVFCFNEGHCLTQRTFNRILSNILEEFLGSASKEISGHSFRAAIPSILAKNPDVSTRSDIMGWGRWNSTSYQSYTRLVLEQKRIIFSKITSLIL